MSVYASFPFPLTNQNKTFSIVDKAVLSKLFIMSANEFNQGILQLEHYRLEAINSMFLTDGSAAFFSKIVWKNPATKNVQELILDGKGFMLDASHVAVFCDVKHFALELDDCKQFLTKVVAATVSGTLNSKLVSRTVHSESSEALYLAIPHTDVEQETKLSIAQLKDKLRFSGVLYNINVSYAKDKTKRSILIPHDYVASLTPQQTCSRVTADPSVAQHWTSENRL